MNSAYKRKKKLKINKIQIQNNNYYLTQKHNKICSCNKIFNKIWII